MKLTDAFEELQKNRADIEICEDTIMELTRNSLVIAKSIDQSLVRMSGKGYDWDNGKALMDENELGTNATSCIQGLDCCIRALEDTIATMTELSEQLEKEEL